MDAEFSVPSLGSLIGDTLSEENPLYSNSTFKRLVTLRQGFG